MPARADRSRGGAAAGALAGALAGVLVFFLIAIGLLLFGEPRDEPEAPLAATPMTPPPGPATPPGEPAPTPSPVPEPETEPEPQDTPTEPVERDPTDADAARFTTTFEPLDGEQVEAVTVDVTGDGWPEIVVVSVARLAVRLDVAAWNGTAYEVTFSDVGGRAERIERFIVRDLSGDGVRDIATVQTAGDGLESLSLWGWDGEQFVRREARGGCWDGSHVYGIVGVDLRDGEIAATCDGSPQPVSEWSSHVYVWDDGAWRLDRTQVP